MARPTKQQQRRARLVRRLVIGAGVLTVAACAAGGWHWQRTLPLERVAVSGFVRADSAEVVRLAALPDSAALFSLDPALVADRVRRTPWVREARVRRLPTGTLGIRVEERVPVALVVAADGRPSHYLDREGYALPLRPHDPFDVPLLRGAVPGYHPTQPVGDAALLDLLLALATADEATAALVSEVTLGPGGDAVLRTSTDGAHGALPVRLGAGAAGGYAAQLRRLHAFWHQAVLPRPHTQFASIDLRFDGQVVTRESEDRSQRPAASSPAARTPPPTADP